MAAVVAADALGRDAINARLGALNHCIDQARACIVIGIPLEALEYLEAAEAHRRAIAATVNARR